MKLKLLLLGIFTTVVLKAQLVNKPFPKLALPNVFSHQKQSIDLLRGKYTLVQVWASWCPVCRKENKGLSAFYHSELKNQETPIGIFSISLDGKQRKKQKTSNPRKQLLDAIAKDKLNWKNHVSDFKGWDSYAAIKLRVRKLPKWLLVSPEGIVLKEEIDLEQLKQIYQQLQKGKSESNIQDFIRKLPSLNNRKGTKKK